MELILGVVTGLLVLVILVVLHELGHAIIARRNGVVVEEFGIGFPPRAWARKLKNGVLFSLNWLPIGGFVKLQGEHDSADKKSDYGNASFWQKTRILLAGVAVNWLIAAVLLTILALFGLPKILDNQFYVSSDAAITNQPITISALTSGYPAETSGLKVGDKILSLDSYDGKQTVSGLIDKINIDKGKAVNVTYERDGKEGNVEVKLRDAESGSVLGAGLSQQNSIRSTWSAPIVGVATAGQMTWSILQGLGDLVSNLFGGIVMQFSPNEATRAAASQDIKAAGESVAGPVGILGTIFPQAEKAGLGQLTLLTAVISLTLAVMNVLPIPALDGGRWFTMTLFRLMKRPLTKDTEEKIQASGFLVLMGLILLITIIDVTRLF